MAYTDTITKPAELPTLSGQINIVHSKAESLRTDCRELLAKVAGCVCEDVPANAIGGGFIGDLAGVYHLLEEAQDALQSVKARL